MDDAFYTLDESVRSARDLIENMRDDAPVDLSGGVRRQNPVLESRVREEGCVLCKHLLTVSRSLKGPECTLEISLHFPSQRTNPFRQADFSEVIQSRYEPLLAGSAKLAKFGGIRASADFEGRRDARLGWPRSAQDTVERRESCLSHFASLGFLHVQAGCDIRAGGYKRFLHAVEWCAEHNLARNAEAHPLPRHDGRHGNARGPYSGEPPSPTPVVCPHRPRWHS